MRETTSSTFRIFSLFAMMFVKSYRSSISSLSLWISEFSLRFSKALSICNNSSGVLNGLVR